MRMILLDYFHFLPWNLKNKCKGVNCWEFNFVGMKQKYQASQYTYKFVYLKLN